MASRVTLPRSRIQEERRKRHVWTLGACVLLVLCCVGALVALSWIPELRVGMVEVTGTQVLASSSVAEFVQGELMGTDAYLFPKNNVLWYPKQKIIASLPAEFPMLQSASIQLQNLHTIDIGVSERSPEALWCGEEMATGTPCYLLDGSGMVYALAADYSPNVYVEYYGSTSESLLPQQYLDPQEFASLSALVQALAEKEPGDPIESVAVDGGGNVQAVFSDGFTLLFTTAQNPSDVLNAFSLALTTDPFTSHPLSDFLYLDLSFGDKLYYKLKGQ